MGSFRIDKGYRGYICGVLPPLILPKQMPTAALRLVAARRGAGVV